MMEHQKAVESLAAERYILGELQTNEREAFEEHFFGCVPCAGEVRDAAKVAAGVRTLEMHVPGPVAHYTRWAIAAAAAIAFGLAYQYAPQVGSRIPRVPPPLAAQVPFEQTIELESTRGPDVINRVRCDQPVALDFVIPPPEHPLRVYSCELRNAGGRPILTIDVSQIQAQDAVRMRLKAGMLHTGMYKLVIRGGDREIAAYPFTVEVR